MHSYTPIFTALAIEAGGITKLARAAKVPVKLLRRYISDAPDITRSEMETISDAWTDLKRNENFWRKNEIDKDVIYDLEERIKRDVTRRKVPDQRLRGLILAGLADDVIDVRNLYTPDELDEFGSEYYEDDAGIISDYAGISIVNDLTEWQLGMLLDGMVEGVDINEGLRLAVYDSAVSDGGIMDVKDSYFWEWFRENFYPEE